MKDGATLLPQLATWIERFAAEDGPWIRRVIFPHLDSRNDTRRVTTWPSTF